MRTAHGHALLHGADQEAAPSSAAEGRQVCGMRGLAVSAQLLVQVRPAVQMLRRARCTSLSGAACKRCWTGGCAAERTREDSASALSHFSRTAAPDANVRGGRVAEALVSHRSSAVRPGQYCVQKADIAASPRMSDSSGSHHLVTTCISRLPWRSLCRVAWHSTQVQVEGSPSASSLRR
jgi:hypothetical protein